MRATVWQRSTINTSCHRPVVSLQPEYGHSIVSSGCASFSILLYSSSSVKSTTTACFFCGSSISSISLSFPPSSLSLLVPLDSSSCAIRCYITLIMYSPVLTIKRLTLNSRFSRVAFLLFSFSSLIISSCLSSIRVWSGPGDGLRRMQPSCWRVSMLGQMPDVIVFLS